MKLIRALLPLLDALLTVGVAGNVWYELLLGEHLAQLAWWPRFLVATALAVAAAIAVRLVISAVRARLLRLPHER